MRHARYHTLRQYTNLKLVVSIRYRAVVPSVPPLSAPVYIPVGCPQRLVHRHSRTRRASLARPLTLRPPRRPSLFSAPVQQLLLVAPHLSHRVH